LLKAGSNMAAMIAMIAMTTSSSIKVKPAFRLRQNGVSCFMVWLTD
jgi:hypothetical protein